ncbi:hypothetical protein N658DRAFT_544222 [Parathielavia hyrcaniae]|uniref:Protein kinase domain-containing protein n=1 Tax=Parathielavia hyrcaniae TaxID=113614 RepID=A0AAN6PWN0_9PEZI|nr:hypothetical protein N658DRAFT_544222 [Parathielavia hyrcaniae]
MARTRLFLATVFHNGTGAGNFKPIVQSSQRAQPQISGCIFDSRSIVCQNVCSLNSSFALAYAELPCTSSRPRTSRRCRDRRSRRARGLRPGEGSDHDEPDQQEPNGMMLLEYFQRGTLHKALCCIAMAHPLKDHLQAYAGQNPPYMEQIPNGVDEDRFVHFDIDPQNIFVGDDDHLPGFDHPVVPGLKLGDFGLGRSIRDLELQHPDYMLMFRRLAKYYFFTPEQFSAEWDYIPQGLGPRDMIPPTRMGLVSIIVMACLITKCHQPNPPFPERIKILDRSSFEFPSSSSSSDDDDDDDDDGGNPPGGQNNNQAGGRLHLRGGGLFSALLNRIRTQPPQDSAIDLGSPPNPDSEDGHTVYQGSLPRPITPAATFPPAPIIPPAPGAPAPTTTTTITTTTTGKKKQPEPDEIDYDPSGIKLPAGEIRVWSYGGYLVQQPCPDDWRHVSRQLCLLVAQCLCDSPKYRPRLEWLEREIEGRLSLIRMRMGGRRIRIRM